MLKWIKKFFFKKYIEGLNNENERKIFIKKSLNSIEKNKPTGVKGKYIKKFTICSTMGPGVGIDFSMF